MHSVILYQLLCFEFTANLLPDCLSQANKSHRFQRALSWEAPTHARQSGPKPLELVLMEVSAEISQQGNAAGKGMPS